MACSNDKLTQRVATKASEPTLREIVSSLPFPAALNEIVGTPRRIILLNDAFTDTFGYDITDCPTVEDWAVLAYPEEDYRLKTFEVWNPLEQKAMREQGPIHFQEVEVRTKDDRTLNVMISARALGSMLIVAFIDVTSQRQVEAELRNVRYSLERTAYELTENLPVGTYTMVQPPDGGMAQFRFLSKRFLEISGLESREKAFADPRNVFVTAHPEDLEAWVALNEKTFAERTPFYGEKRIIVNGEVRWISAESNPRTLPDGSTLWEGVLTDITDRKHAEESLARAKARAEQLERIKTDFLTRMSHEIRTPLTLVLGLTDLLADECDRSSQKEKVGQLRHAGNMLLGIVNDILDLSKIEAGQLITEEQPFNLAELIVHIEAFKASITSPDLKLVVKQPTGPTPVLVGDQRRIEQILGNLIGNAIKFTDSGTVEVSLSVKNQADGHVRLGARVKDTGRGIPAEHMPALFTPFMQGDTATAYQYGGTGLGLCISKELAELMGGCIGATSEVGKGSEFWVELPIKALPADEAAVTIEALHQPVACDASPRLVASHNPESLDTTSSDKPLKGLRILVVDDSLSIRGLIRALLLREGAAVEVAENGSIAIEILQARGKLFDCVMMDVQMPVLDGLTATQRIRQIHELDTLPILAMTAGLLAEQQIHARQAGMTDVIPKPIQKMQMVQRILNAVGTQNEPPTPDRLTANAIPLIPGINRFYANRALDGNVEMFNFLAEVFIEELADFSSQWSLASVNQAQPDDFQAMARLAHSLRGSAKQMGALELSEAAAQLETAVTTHSSNCMELAAHVSDQLSALIQSLRHYLDARA